MLEHGKFEEHREGEGRLFFQGESAILPPQSINVSCRRVVSDVVRQRRHGTIRFTTLNFKYKCQSLRVIKANVNILDILLYVASRRPRSKYYAYMHVLTLLYSKRKDKVYVALRERKDNRLHRITVKR